MPALVSSFTRLLKDPPPELVFEIRPDAVLMARSAGPQSVQSVSLALGVITPSPLHENVAGMEPLNEAVRRLAAGGVRGKKRSAALLLPDHSAHVAVLEFAKLPDNAEEQRSIIRFRLKRSVPFDVDAAALSYWIQDTTASSKGREVVAAVTALEIVSRYEAPFRAAGIHPGFVSLAALACMDLVEPAGIVAIARLSGNMLSGAVLTVLVRQEATLKVFRSIQISDLSLSEIAGHLHQTFVFVEDNLQALPRELLLAGFGPWEEDALRDFPDDFQVPVRVLGGDDTGIRGYLKGVAA